MYSLPILSRQMTISNSNVSSFDSASNLSNHKTKCSIVCKGLKGVYAFVNKLRTDMLLNKMTNQIDIIIATFNTHCTIYSTVKLPQPNPSYNLINVKHVSFEELLTIIENQIIACGGTDFLTVEQANKYILENQQYLNLGNGKYVPFIMSDGQHSGNRSDILNTASNRYACSLGIGNSQQYDEELLKHLSSNFVSGYDDDIIKNSILENNLNVVSKIASNVNISLITVEPIQNIKTNLRYKSIKNIDHLDPTIFSNDDQLFMPILMNNSIKLVGKSPLIPLIQTNLTFAFFVDISGSMSDPIFDNIDPIANIDISNIDQHVDQFIDTNNSNYKEYNFVTINEFHSYNEHYFNIDSKHPIYFKITCDQGTFYSKTLNKPELFEQLEDQLINLYCDLYDRFKPIKYMDKETLQTSIIELAEYVGSPSINKVYCTINKEQNHSKIKIYIIALINQIKKIATSLKKRSDRLLDQLQNMPMELLRSVSATVSSTYSQTTDIDQISINDYDNSSDLCMMCNEKVKAVVYGCGHICACMECSKHVLFKEVEVEELPTLNRLATNYMNYDRSCPICRKEVNSVRKLLIIDENKNTMFKCIEKDCINLSNRVSNDCNHLTYCNSCWKHNKTDGTLTCKCGIPITSYYTIYT